MNTKIFLLTLALLAAGAARTAPPSEEGKAIFTARCASCHSVNKVLTGPALAGLHERRSLDWIVSFIRSSQTMVKSGDKQAVALFEQFNKIPMPDHTDLTAEHVTNIVEYIKAESKSAAADKAPFARPTRIQAPYKPFTTADYPFFIGFLAVVGLLVAALLFAVQLKQYERNTSGR